MKLHLFDAVAGAWANFKGNADGSAHADIRKVGGTAVAAGQAAMAASIPVTMANNQPAQKVITDGHYETVAASQSDQVLGATGAVGDYLDTLVIVPANLNPGVVQIKDGAGSAVTVFAGGTGSVNELRPIVVRLGSTATGAGWKVTTGADVSVIATGKFT